FASNGRFYVNYTLGSVTRISEFTVSGNPDLANAGSERVLLEFSQPFGNHNGGMLVFDDSGYLLIASGDGGSAGDPGNRAQNPNELLGKILRIDVD
ncbi:PQQ-dependent sugar dehydrogenase, partial [Clostridium perfringens]|nr:PQQ-dependent sugar dehydrogenase [Clostridium perfringens]